MIWLLPIFACLFLTLLENLKEADEENDALLFPNWLIIIVCVCVVLSARVSPLIRRIRPSRNERIADGPEISYKEISSKKDEISSKKDEISSKKDEISSNKKDEISSNKKDE